ncbi:MAG: hypothetical protein WAP47_21085, partial [Candidatus Rokuibacteriota bacterium]
SERELTQGLQEILKTYRGHERRKWGVARSGLCLLVAWTAELVMVTQSRFRRLDTPELLAAVYRGVSYVDGHRVPGENTRKVAA